MIENHTDSTEEAIDPVLEAVKERQSIALFTTLRSSLEDFAKREEEALIKKSGKV
jgi:hypothetical protein